MKRSAAAILTAALLALPFTASAVSYDQDTNYRGGGVTLRMNVPMGSVLTPGEEIAFKYQTLLDAYVIVFNIDSEGYVHILHPEDPLTMSAARRTYDVPEGRNSSLVVSGETGVEFVFALTVPDRNFVDEDELDHLLSLDTDPDAPPYRVDGDPFLAANIVAAELVRGISRRSGVFLDFTYFYVTERVDHPCYLCGECDRRDAVSECERYQIVADFERTQPLAYPMRRGYEIVDMGVAVETYDEPDPVGNERTVVNFYPYTSEVYTYSRPWVYRVNDPYWYDPWYWDPWYAGWYYYPGARPGWGWGITVGVGWGWGGYWGNYWGWGGYWCSPNYYPHHWGGGGGGGTYVRPEKFKTKYKSGGSALVNNRRQSITRDGALRVGTKNLRSTKSRTQLAGNSRASAYKNSRRVTGAKVSGTSRARTQTTYKRRTASIRGNSGTASIRSGSRTTSRRSDGYKRSTPQKRTYSGKSRSSGTKTRSYKSSPRSSGNRSSVRSSGRSSSRGKPQAKSSSRSTPRAKSSSRSSGKSRVKGSTRSSGSRSRGTTRSGGSRSGGKRR